MTDDNELEVWRLKISCVEMMKIEVGQQKVYRFLWEYGVRSSLSVQVYYTNIFISFFTSLHSSAIINKTKNTERGGYDNDNNDDNNDDGSSPPFHYHQQKKITSNPLAYSSSSSSLAYNICFTFPAVGLIASANASMNETGCC